MVTAVKMSKNLNSKNMEELVSSLRIHEIELEEDEPWKRGNSVALKFKGKSKKDRSLQAEEEESEEDKVSLLSIRVNQLWKKKQNDFRGYEKSGGRFESTSR